MAKKFKPQRPDEVFSIGPITMGRFGKDLILQTNWEEEEFDKFQKHLIENYPKVVRDIDALVSEIKDLIKVLPPEKLLNRAFQEMVEAHKDIESESEIGEEEAISLRMIDYVQSVIAAVPPAKAQRDDVTDEEWKKLRSKIKQLFHSISNYRICHNAKNRADDPNLDENFEEFQAKAQVYWCDVRGKRYPVHQLAHLEDLFLPHTDVFQELFGISGKQFVMEINKIWHALSFGIPDVREDFDRFQHDILDAVDKKVEHLLPGSKLNLPDLMAQVIQENDWEERKDDISGRLALTGMDLCDVQKTTTLPEKLLERLSWLPGEDKDFFAAGELCGWPLRIWPIFKRPFIRLGDRYYCFDLNNLFDNLYRVMQRIIMHLKPDYQETWNTIQKRQSENLPLKYLEHLLPGAKVLKEVYYRGKSDKGVTDWCETDGLVIYDDHLFIVEARGGAFTYTPPATDFPAYIKSLENLVLKPAKQGQRFLTYLKDTESVPLFDSDHNQIGELRKSDFRRITIFAVTVDSFTELAAQVQHLHKIGVEVGDHPIWAISLDDLRIYKDIFENPLVFLHYVEQRMQAFHSDIIQFDDELDHFGLYLAHNHYSTYAKKLQGNYGAQINHFTGYRSEIDKFFSACMLDPNTPCPLKQNTPVHLQKIVEVLSRSNKSGRSEVAAYLLDMVSDSRKQVANYINQELKKQTTPKRPIYLSIHGNSKLTISCWTEHWGPKNSVLALNHARCIVVMHNEARRLLIELSYSMVGELQDVNWTWVELAGIPSSQLPRLRSEANNMRQKRIARTTAERQKTTGRSKIGRNESCPCSSGKKYKKCCWSRDTL